MLFRSGQADTITPFLRCQQSLRAPEATTTKRETRSQPRRSTVHLPTRATATAPSITGLSRKPRSMSCLERVGPSHRITTGFRGLNVTFCNDLLADYPDSGGPGETPHKEGVAVQNASRGVSVGRIAALTSMVSVTYAKKLKKCLKLDPRCPKVEEVRFGARSFKRTTENVVIAWKSSREVVVCFFGWGRVSGRKAPDLGLGRLFCRLRWEGTGVYFCLAGSCFQQSRPESAAADAARPLRERTP